MAENETEEQPQHAPAPLVSYKPLLLFCFGILHAAALNQLKVAAIKILIQEVIAELEHAFSALPADTGDSDLERPTDRDMRLRAFQLIRLPELIQFTEVRASQ